MSSDNDRMAYSVGDANAAISELVKWMEAGADVIISRGGKPVARVIPYIADPDETGTTDITIQLPDPKE